MFISFHTYILHQLKYKIHSLRLILHANTKAKGNNWMEPHRPGCTFFLFLSFFFFFFFFQFFILENSLEVFGSLIRRETQLKEVSSHFVLCSVLQVRQLYCRFVDYPLGIPRFFHLAFAIFHWPKPWFMVADWIKAIEGTSFSSWVMGIS